MTVNQIVWKIIRGDAALQKDLRREIINIRGLAKYLINCYQITASIDAVISAVRRFPEHENHPEEEKTLQKVFKESIITTKNNITKITVTTALNETLKRIKDELNKNAKIITGTNGVTLLIEQSIFTEVRKRFSNEEIEKINEHLAEISITVNERAIKTKGVLAKLATEIALANINIEEMITSPPEFLIYVKQDNLVRVHESIMAVCREFLG